MRNAFIMQHSYTYNIRQLRRGFTLVELLVVIAVVVLLIGLLVMGMSHAMALAKKTATQQSVLALKNSVEQFRQDFGFVPPLVKDGYTGTPDISGPLRSVSGRRSVPNVYNFADAGERIFLQDDTSPDYRFSIYSLSYYIMGALGTNVDGVNGPGAHTPKRDGSFDRLTNETYGPLFDAKSGKVASVDSAQGRIELQDGNGVAFRYYRWAAVKAGDTGYDSKKPLLNRRVPKFFFDDPNDTSQSPAEANPKLRNAAYVIVAAGADGVFGDIGVERDPGNPSSKETKDSLGQAAGTRYQTDADAEKAARKDNVMEVGS